MDDTLQSLVPWSGVLNPSEDVQFDLGSIIIDSESEITAMIFGDSITYNNELFHEPFYIPSTTAGVVSPVQGCSGDQITLSAWGGESYLWYQAADDGANIEAGEQITVELGTMGQYHVLIIQDYCTFEDSILIDPSGCAQVTAFSPNGDHVNDFLFIDNLDLNSDNTVIIYNRYGDEVSRFSNYKNEDVVWRGNTYNGAQLPVGTYYFVVESNSENSFSSWVQILR